MSLFRVHLSLALARAALGSEASLDRRLADEGYWFDDALPPSRPVTDQSFYNDDFRVPAFRECGGQDKIEYHCEAGCTCEQQDDNRYSKWCVPPAGEKSCNSAKAKKLLHRAQTKAADIQSEVKEAMEAKEEAAEQAAKLAKQAVQAKKEAVEAAKELKAAESSENVKAKVLVNEVVMEIHEKRTKTIPQESEEAWSRAAKVIAEAQGKIEEGHLKVDAARKNQARIEKEGMKKLHKEILHKDKAQVEKLEKQLKKLQDAQKEAVGKATVTEAEALGQAQILLETAAKKSIDLRGQRDAKAKERQDMKAELEALKTKAVTWEATLQGK